MSDETKRTYARKHTPGTWTTRNTRAGTGPTMGVVDEAGRWLAKCHPFNGEDVEREEAAANAELMAAAPDMADALRAIVAAYADGAGGVGEVAEAIKDAHALLLWAGVAP